MDVPRGSTAVLLPPVNLQHKTCADIIINRSASELQESIRTGEARNHHMSSLVSNRNTVVAKGDNQYTSSGAKVDSVLFTTGGSASVTTIYRDL
jgi:hypothetical protein